MTEATKEKCIFCDIAAGKAPAHIIAEDNLSLCILDIHPYTKGHGLVISKRHVPWWHELTDEESASFIKKPPPRHLTLMQPLSLRTRADSEKRTSLEQTVARRRIPHQAGFQA